MLMFTGYDFTFVDGCGECSSCHLVLSRLPMLYDYWKMNCGSGAKSWAVLWKRNLGAYQGYKAFFCFIAISYLMPPSTQICRSLMASCDFV